MTIKANADKEKNRDNDVN